MVYFVEELDLESEINPVTGRLYAEDWRKMSGQICSVGKVKTIRTLSGLRQGIKTGR